jgi:putative ABC transport system substrate-binding protein
MAEELVRKRVDVIFAASNEAAIAAARATKSIPIVFWGVNYPVELGLVDSLAHPGGNVTGVALYVGPAEFTKTLDFLKELAPQAKRLSYLYEAAHMRRVDGTRWEFADDYIETAARRVGFESHQYALSPERGLGIAFEDMLAAKTQAVYVSFSKFTIEARQRIIDFANTNRLPSAFNSFDDVFFGGLLCYGPDMRDLFRRAADSVDKVLRGAHTKDLPVELPTRFRLGVSAGVILTHCAEVKVTPLGEDDGLCGAVDAEPGASSGDTSDGPKGRRGEIDRQAAGLLAQHGTAIFA